MNVCSLSLLRTFDYEKYITCNQASTCACTYLYRCECMCVSKMSTMKNEHHCSTFTMCWSINNVWTVHAINVHAWWVDLSRGPVRNLQSQQSNSLGRYFEPSWNCYSLRKVIYKHSPFTIRMLILVSHTLEYDLNEDPTKEGKTSPQF